MRKSVNINFTRRLVREKLTVLQKVGEMLLDSKLDINKPLDSLMPLGMALLEGFDLFSILLFGSYNKIHNLFDGGEDKGPNIDTRLKFIRDLFSACEYVTSYTKTSLIKTKSKTKIPKVSVVGINWLEVINLHIEQHEENVLTEVSNFINETLEALLSLGLMLDVSNLKLVSREIWQETNRHILHIRDHYDYAETYLIDVIRPASEGE